MTLAEVLGRAPHVLLDFDGPVCSVYGGSSSCVVADRLRAELRSRGVDLPAAVLASDDPLDVLRHAAGANRATLLAIEMEFIAQEVEAVATATGTPGAREAMEALVSAGHSITIVSNNSPDAVRTYLDRANLSRLVRGVAARIPAQPGLMKPHPRLLHDAMERLNAEPRECAMIGDSETDVEVAHGVGATAIAFANRPGKLLRLTRLAPEAVITSMRDIVAAVGPSEVR